MVKFRIKTVRDGYGKPYYKIQRSESWWKPWYFVDTRGGIRYPLVQYTNYKEYESDCRKDAEQNMQNFRMEALYNMRIG